MPRENFNVYCDRNLWDKTGNLYVQKANICIKTRINHILKLVFTWIIVWTPIVNSVVKKKRYIGVYLFISYEYKPVHNSSSHKCQNVQNHLLSYSFLFSKLKDILFQQIHLCLFVFKKEIKNLIY